jgi:hypothetical protein
MATDHISFLPHGGAFNTLQPVVVPRVLGMGRTLAEKTLSDALLRYIAKFPFSASGDGTAVLQVPAAGVTVPPYSVVTVEYPTPLGPLPDAVVQGPVLSGWVAGDVTRITVDERGASLMLSISAGVSFEFNLYKDAVPTVREGWMRRGAMLALAQRALSGKHRVQIDVEDWVIKSLTIFG